MNATTPAVALRGRAAIQRPEFTTCVAAELLTVPCPCCAPTAAVVQASWRGFAERRRLHAAASQVQAAWRGCAARQMSMMLEANRHLAAEDIQRVFRGCLARRGLPARRGLLIAAGMRQPADAPRQGVGPAQAKQDGVEVSRCHLRGGGATPARSPAHPARSSPTYFADAACASQGQLRQELLSLPGRELRSRIREAGASGALTLEAADDDDDSDDDDGGGGGQNAGLVDLLLQNDQSAQPIEGGRGGGRAAADRGLLEQLRAELEQLPNRELRSRAREAGASHDAMEAAADSDEPRSALVQLLLGIHLSGRGGDASPEPAAAAAAAAATAARTTSDEDYLQAILQGGGAPVQTGDGNGYDSDDSETEYYAPAGPTPQPLEVLNRTSSDGIDWPREWPKIATTRQGRQG